MNLRWKASWLVVLARIASLALARTRLTVFVGGQQRPDVIGSLLERFTTENPDIIASYEVGGATSEAQQQYLSTVLTSHSGDIDILLINVVRPVIAVALIFYTLTAIHTFDISYALTHGSPGRALESLVIYIHSTTLNLNVGYAAALSVVLFVMSLVITIFYLRWIYSDTE